MIAPVLVIDVALSLVELHEPIPQFAKVLWMASLPSNINLTQLDITCINFEDALYMSLMNVLESIGPSMDA